MTDRAASDLAPVGNYAVLQPDAGGTIGKNGCPFAGKAIQKQAGELVRWIANFVEPLWPKAATSWKRTYFRFAPAFEPRNQAATFPEADDLVPRSSHAVSSLSCSCPRWSKAAPGKLRIMPDAPIRELRADLTIAPTMLTRPRLVRRHALTIDPLEETTNNWF